MTSIAPNATKVVVRVPAKVNLELRVGPLREDGFHDLATTFHAVDLFDKVTVSAADDVSVTVRGLGAGLVPEDDSNLAVRAAKALAQRYCIEAGCHIDILKAIPVAGGMAGGSADAAATLLACDALWGLGRTRVELEEVAATLGSDVPFALTGGTAIGTGRGDQVIPALATGSYQWLFALNHTGLSTPEVYRECDRLREGQEVPEPASSQTLLAALRLGDVEKIAAAMHNDLEEAALSLMPRLHELIETGLEMGALAAMVSGSGPTVAFLAEGPAEANALRRVLAAGGLADEYVTATSTPHGAQIVASE